jgi:hypothetical protein
MTKSGKDENFIVYGSVLVWREITPKDAFDGYLISCGTMCTKADGSKRT